MRHVEGTTVSVKIRPYFIDYYEGDFDRVHHWLSLNLVFEKIPPPANSGQYLYVHVPSDPSQPMCHMLLWSSLKRLLNFSRKFVYLPYNEIFRYAYFTKRAINSVQSAIARNRTYSGYSASVNTFVYIYVNHNALWQCPFSHPEVTRTAWCILEKIACRYN